MTRIRRYRHRGRALLAAAAALAVAACGNGTRIGTGPESSGSPSPTGSPPSPAGTQAASESPASPSPSADPPSPAAAPPSRAASRSPSPTPTPSPTPSPDPSPTPSPSQTPSYTVTAVPGRPLRHRRRLLTPGVADGSDAVRHPDHERLGALPAPLRLELHRRWLAAARMEHGSVPAFGETAVLLAAVGAPLDLVAAAHTAALDEVEHTRVSYALANAYGAASHAPGALPRLLGRRPGRRLFGTRHARRRLAVEALRDGCFGEGYAAAVALASARAAIDPAPRAALERIASDEAAHAELSWRVLGWCLATGGPAVRRAVARALRRLPAPPATAGTTAYADHGWPGGAELAALHADVRAAVTERATGLLALSR